MSHRRESPRGAFRIAIAVLAIALALPAAPAYASHRPVLEKSDWLSIVNFYRATAGLPPLSEKARLSAASRRHSRYVVLNQFATHEEIPGRPGYTREGAAAGHGNVVAFRGDARRLTDRYIVERWIAAPLHALRVFEPALAKAGFGQFYDASRDLFLAATMDVVSGMADRAWTEPVVWPGPGTQVPLTTFHGNETPNPFDYCPGYHEPAGLTIMVHPRHPESLKKHSVVRDGGKSLEHCAFRHGGAIFLMPKRPLVDGNTYNVRVKTNRRDLRWSFSVGEVRPPEPAEITGDAFFRTFQSATTIPVGWHSSDRKSGIDHYEVRYQETTPSGTLGSARTWLMTADETATFQADPGHTYCFFAHATDGAGNDSRSGPQRCTAVPFTALQLAPSSFWTPEANDAYYGGTALKTIVPDAVLSLLVTGARQIALVATRCPTCGSVVVTLDGHELATVDLYSPTMRSREIVPLGSFFSPISGTVEIRVTSTLEDVVIEGVGVSLF